jgi:hypothetical protein
MIKSTFPEADFLVGRQVQSGSPGFEDLETIVTVRETNVYGSDNLRIQIDFESGFFTNMSPADFELFIKNGVIVFERWFRTKHNKSIETIELI